MRPTNEQHKEEAAVPRYYVQQSDGASGWKTVAGLPADAQLACMNDGWRVTPPEKGRIRASLLPAAKLRRLLNATDLREAD